MHRVPPPDLADDPVFARAFAAGRLLAECAARGKGANVEARGLATLRWPVHGRAQGQAHDVWIGDGWVVKRLRPGMEREDPRWRRSPAVAAAWIDRHRTTTAFRPHLPRTVLVTDTVSVQQRCDPHAKRFAIREAGVRAIAHAMGLGNIHADNVGWTGDPPNVPVFLDVEYLGPDLTVALLLKRPRGRTWQGELPFWATWGPTYLERMVRNLRRHLPPATRIVVMTDRPDDVPAGCDVALLTEDHPGWWSKLWQFRRDVTCGRVLYLDLDNVVAGPLTELVGLTPDPVVMMDDRHRPGMPNASTLLYYAERVRYLWDDYAADPDAWRARYPETTWPHASDQAYVTGRLLAREGRYMPYFQEALGEGYCLNSRTELEAGAPADRCRLVFGCWTPKPHESRHPFYTTHWSDT